jgi:glutamine synthetase
MPSRGRRTGSGIVTELERRGVDFVRCQFIDLIGIARNRLVPRAEIATAARRGLEFGAFGTTLDIDDIPSDPELGSHSGDFSAVPDTTSLALLPWVPRTGHMFCDLVAADGTAWPSCARSRLRGLAAETEETLGMPELAYEAEGYLLVREPGGGYAPAFRGHGWGAELLDAQQPFIEELASVVAAMGLPLERMQVEGGHSQFEAVLHHRAAVEAAQDHFRFKQAFRAVAGRHGLVGSFMPKPIRDRDGSGLHIHLSTRGRGKNALFDRGQLSATGRQFVGGLIAHAPALVAIGCPSINSYKRMQPGWFAPTHAIWGPDNRSALVRVVSSRGTGHRIEFRAADGTCNPFLVGAALLAAGLDGVRRRLDPGDPYTGDVARSGADALMQAGVARTPSSLDRALDALEADTDLADILGREMVRAFLLVKRSECAKYAAYVSDWEYRYYAEQH